MSTNNPMTQEQLDAIQRRAGSATEGPWAHWRGWNQGDNCIKSDTDEGMYTVAEVISEAGNAQFIAHAREDIPDLLAEVERLRALIKGQARAWDEGAETAWQATCEGWNGETAGEEYTTLYGVAPFREANEDIPNPYEQGQS